MKNLVSLDSLSPRDLLKRVRENFSGQDRAGQNEMAAMVYEALCEQRHLIVEAGTGTGKSLGYLVPAVLLAAGEGKRSVISTATLALQRQIIRKDAPAVLHAIYEMTGSRPKIALLKGWNNYVCLRKAGGGYPEDDALISRAEGKYGSTAIGEEVVRLRQWAMETDSGERDELVPGVSDRAWAQVSLPKNECIGDKCPLRGSCFPMLARAKAAEADVIVTNHALLGVQAAQTPVLPPAEAFIIDEAHELVNRVTSQLSVSLNKYDLRNLARALRTAGIGDLEFDSLENEFGDALTSVGEGRLVSIPSVLGDVLIRAVGVAQDALGRTKDLDIKTETGMIQKKLLRTRLTEMLNLCTDALGEKTATGRLVCWVSLNKDGTSVLHSAPVDVAADISRELFKDCAAVLTSATLQVNGNFQTIASNVGFNFPDQGPWEGVSVGTPFVPAEQGILYMAAHLPEPGREGYGEENLEELASLIEASKGGCLGLFSSFAAARAAAEYVRGRSSYPLYCQGEDGISNLIAAFGADYHASLFGTLSLWQGVDVPGMTNRLVVIDRIPFARPDDPLMQARMQAVNERGGNGFMEVSAAQAALLLAQGSGRLLRSATDKGVVAILDSRLTKRRYGSYLRRSLPDFWPTTQRDAVLGALKRISLQEGEAEEKKD